jgi:hypothetical protein
LINTTVLITNRTAKKTVQRFRLRSTSEPPPIGPLPVPTPNAPDRPASLPECMRIRKTRPTQMMTWTMSRIVTTVGDGSGRLLPGPDPRARRSGGVQGVHDLDRLGPKRLVDGLIVLI